MSVEGTFVAKTIELSILAMRALCALHLITFQEIDNLGKSLEADGIDIDGADFWLWNYAIIGLALERMPEEDADYILSHDGSDASLTRAGGLVRASIDLLAAVADMHKGLSEDGDESLDKEDVQGESSDDLPPPPDEDEEELGPLSIGEIMALAGVIGYCGEVLRRHEINGDLPPQPELDAIFSRWRARKAAAGRVKQVQDTADERWRREGLKIAQAARRQKPWLVYEDLAKLVEHIPEAPATRRGITKALKKWEEDGLLPPKVSKNSP